MTLKNWFGKSLWLGFFMVIAVCYGQAAIIYVDSAAVAGLNDGSSWQNAYLKLEDALTAAVAPDEIWVANGTYYPGPSGTRTANYWLKNGVAVYGGFEGLGGAEETQLSQRDWMANVCILSGDLNQSGTRDTFDAYHVVSGISRDTTAIIDGFTITMGAADGPGIDNFGGGITMFNGGGTVRNCILERNFSSNIAGAAYTNRGCRFISCTFRNNVSAFRAGALYLTGTQPTKVYNCTFINNVATNLAGALFAQNPNLRVFQCSFTQNNGLLGAGIYCVNASVQVRNSIFWENIGAEIGGTTPIVSHCLVQGGFPAGNNIIDDDPRFADTLLHLLACSPAVDAGDSLTFLTGDQDGNSRPFDGDNDGTAKWDLGAFESQLQGVVPPANPIVGRNPACALGQDEPYTVTNNSPASIYSWSLSGGGTIDGSNVGDTVLVDWGSTLGTYLMVVTETVAATGCFNSDSLVISLDTVPVVTVSPSGNDSVCTGDSLQLSASGAGVSYQWTYNGNPISGATGSQYFAGPAGVYNAYLTDGNGCRDTAQSGMDLFNHPLPVVSISPNGNQGICTGDSLTLTANGGVSQQWYQNGQALTGETGTSLTVATAGRFNMIQVDARGCQDSSAQPVITTINPLPVVSVNPSAGTDTVCPGDTLPILAAAAGATGFQWLLDGQILGGANANPHPAVLTGHYNVLLTDSNNCVDSAAVGHDLVVGDFENPTLLCQDTTIFLDASGQAAIDFSYVDAGSSDNCALDTAILSQRSFACADTGVQSINVTLQDGSGNSANCTSQVTVEDTLRPTAICLNPTLYLNGAGNLTVVPADLDGGSFDNCGIGNFFISQTNFSCADTGTQVLTLTVQDISGNLDQCTSTVTIADSSRPAALCQDTVVFLDATGNVSISASNIDAGSTDNCGLDTLFADQLDFTCADVPSVQVTLTVRDISGNTAFCQGLVRVRDTVAPVALCRDTLIFIDNSGQALLGPADVDQGSSDNCQIAFAGISQGTFTCADTGANPVTLTIVDADTNISTCIATVTIRDTVAPTAVCSDTTFYLDSFGVAIVDPLVFGANSVDNCTFFDTAYVDVGAFGCTDLGQYPVTLVIADFSGQTDSCSGTVTIADSTGPFALCRDTSLVLGPAGFVTLAVGDLDLGTTDNCALDTIFIDRDTFFCADAGPNQVVFTAVDALGNTSTCISQVEVVDSVAPNAICRDTLLYLNVSGQASLMANDLDNGSSDNCLVDSFALSQVSFGCQDTGLLNLTLTVFDGYGNPASCLAQVTVRDTLSPVAVCTDTTVYLDGNGTYTLSFNEVGGASFDNCLVFNTAISQANFSCADTGLNSVSVLVEDPSGNAASCVAQVRVLDSLSPIADCRDTTLFLDSLGNLLVNAQQVAGNSRDNCQLDTSFLDLTAFTCADTGSNILQLTLVDVSGNQSQCLVDLTVVDNRPPSMVCTDTTLFLDAGGQATLTQQMVDAGSFDACGIVFASLSRTNFTCADVGLVPVALLLEDASGNTASCLVQVQVRDTIAPEAFCKGDTVYVDPQGNIGLLPGDLDDGSTDDCGVDSLLLLPATLTCADLGTNLSQLIVVDVDGNRDTCSTTVLLLDTVAPVAVCDTQVVQLDSNGLGVLSASLVGAASFDNCGLDSIALSRDTFNCRDLGFVQVTLFMDDPSENADSCALVVEVVDSTGAAAARPDLGPDTTACNGDTLVLNPGNFAQYLWSTGDTTLDLEVDTAGLYWVAVVDSAGCPGEDSLQVSAHQVANPGIVTESGETVVCQNDSLLLLANAGFSSYLWSNGSQTNTTTVYTQGIYSLVVTDTTGCARIEEIPISFSPTPAPNPMISPADPVTLCESETVTLNAGTGYFAYLWSNGATTTTISVAQAGTFSVEVWNGFGCHSTSPPVNVVLSASPLPQVTQQGDSLVCLTSGVSYQWYQNGNAIFGANDSVFAPNGSGVYVVEVFYANGCSRESIGTSVIVATDEATLALSQLQLYPNPSQGRISVRSLQPIPGKLHLEISNVLGQPVGAYQWRGFGGAEELNLEGLPAGLYQLRFRYRGKSTTLRLVIQ